jgi:hypothetical protein
MRSACRDARKLLSNGFAVASAVVVGFESSSSTDAVVVVAVRARFASGPRVGLVDIANDSRSNRAVVGRGNTTRGVGPTMRFAERFRNAFTNDADVADALDARTLGRGIARWNTNVAIFRR